MMAGRCLTAAAGISFKAIPSSLRNSSTFFLRTNLSRPTPPIGKVIFARANHGGPAAVASDLIDLQNSPRPPSFHPSQSRKFSSVHGKLSGSFLPFNCHNGLLLQSKNNIQFRTVANFSTDTIFEMQIPPGPNDTVIKPKVEGAPSAATESFVVPDVPVAPDLGIGEMILQAPTSDLVALGLATWTPAGLLRQGLDFLHCTLDMPWWAAIVASTIVVRILLFPLVIVSQKNAAIMQKSLPEMQRLQLRMSDARQRGDVMASAQAAGDLQTFMKSGGFNPMKNLIPALIQAPIFMSFFFGLRKMAEAPVESMKEGGLWWFTDLTVGDPYFLLPLMTSLTLAAVIELGVDSGMSTNQMAGMKYFMRSMPIFTFLFTSGIIGFFPVFPSAILVYWFTSNAISLAQTGLLKIPVIRAKCGIPAKVKHNPEDLPMKKKTFRESMAESQQNSRIARELDDRFRLDAVNFRQAGMGPIPKTYKYDPTKVPVLKPVAVKPAAVSSVPGKKAAN